MSSCSDNTKKFGTPYLEVEYGGGSARVFHGYLVFEFICSCEKKEINCECIKNKKKISRNSIEEFNKLNLSIYGERIIENY